VQPIYLEGNLLSPKEPKEEPVKRNSQINYTLNGTAWSTSQSVNLKHIFTLRYSACAKSERDTLKALFDNGGVQQLSWYDDTIYDVIWGGSFNLTKPLGGNKGYYSGSIRLYEV
jgi:hypothetical protein